MTRRHLQLCVLLLMAGTASAQTAPVMDANRWKVNTAPPPKPETETDTAETGNEAQPPLNLRVYKDFDGRIPRDGQNPYAVDVSAVMTRCADGSLIVTAIVIGGQLTPLDNRCPNNSK